MDDAAAEAADASPGAATRIIASEAQCGMQIPHPVQRSSSIHAPSPVMRMAWIGHSKTQVLQKVHPRATRQTVLMEVQPLFKRKRHKAYRIPCL